MVKLFHLIIAIFEWLSLPILLLLCLIARYTPKSITVGIGPEPLINNIYHKKALLKYGYTAETFVAETYYITDEFDIHFGKSLSSANRYLNKLFLRFSGMICFIFAIFRYRCLYFYFNGGPLSLSRCSLWRIEPYLYKIADIKTVIMPYGSDIQDLSKCPNLVYRHKMSQEYPSHRFRRKQIEEKLDLWTFHADHIISGCDWVYYMFYWDTLMLGHFAIDTELFQPSKTKREGALKILHAPNHRQLKGTDFFIKAVDELKSEGHQIELTILEKVPNGKIKEAIAAADVIADQLIIGWYAMFAIEAMALGKPVMCYLRPDLIHLYQSAELIKEDEIPILNTSTETVKADMKKILDHREELEEIGIRSREFVLNHHSLEKIGSTFHSINQSLKL